MATIDRTKDSNKRSHDSMKDSEGETEGTRKSFEYVEKYELKDVMQGISNILNTLANLMINFESHRNELANIKQDIYGKHGVEKRLQLEQSQPTLRLAISQIRKQNMKKRHVKLVF